jgi:hypothetical protein
MGSNEKAIRETDRTQMSGMQWHWLSLSDAAGGAGRKMYPVRCKICGGKGRITEAANRGDLEDYAPMFGGARATQKQAPGGKWSLSIYDSTLLILCIGSKCGSIVWLVVKGADRGGVT